jgi:hypothetical protein
MDLREILSSSEFLFPMLEQGIDNRKRQGSNSYLELAGKAVAGLNPTRKKTLTMLLRGVIPSKYFATISESERKTWVLNAFCAYCLVSFDSKHEEVISGTPPNVIMDAIRFAEQYLYPDGGVELNSLKGKFKMYSSNNGIRTGNSPATTWEDMVAERDNRNTNNGGWSAPSNNAPAGWAAPRQGQQQDHRGVWRESAQSRDPRYSGGGEATYDAWTGEVKHNNNNGGRWGGGQPTNARTPAHHNGGGGWGQHRVEAQQASWVDQQDVDSEWGYQQGGAEWVGNVAPSHEMRIFVVMVGAQPYQTRLGELPVNRAGQLLQQYDRNRYPIHLFLDRKRKLQTYNQNGQPMPADDGFSPVHDLHDLRGNIVTSAHHNPNVRKAVIYKNTERLFKQQPQGDVYDGGWGDNPISEPWGDFAPQEESRPQPARGRRGVPREDTTYQQQSPTKPVSPQTPPAPSAATTVARPANMYDKGTVFVEMSAPTPVQNLKWTASTNQPLPYAAPCYYKAEYTSEGEENMKTDYKLHDVHGFISEVNHANISRRRDSGKHILKNALLSDTERKLNPPPVVDITTTKEVSNTDTAISLSVGIDQDAVLGLGNKESISFASLVGKAEKLNTMEAKAVNGVKELMLRSTNLTELFAGMSAARDRFTMMPDIAENDIDFKYAALELLTSMELACNAEVTRVCRAGLAMPLLTTPDVFGSWASLIDTLTENGMATAANNLTQWAKSYHASILQSIKTWDMENDKLTSKNWNENHRELVINGTAMEFGFVNGDTTDGSVVVLASRYPKLVEAIADASKKAPVSVTKIVFVGRGVREEFHVSPRLLAGDGTLQGGFIVTPFVASPIPRS